MRDEDPAQHASVMVERSVDLLDEGRLAEAGALGEQAISELTAGCGADWQQLDVPTLLRRLGRPERGRTLARALWLTSAVAALEQRHERARPRCQRAMELYARLRIESEQLDVRAARELGMLSAQLSGTRR